MCCDTMSVLLSETWALLPASLVKIYPANAEPSAGTLRDFFSLPKPYPTSETRLGHHLPEDSSCIIGSLKRHLCVYYLSPLRRDATQGYVYWEIRRVSIQAIVQILPNLRKSTCLFLIRRKKPGWLSLCLETEVISLSVRRQSSCFVYSCREPGTDCDLTGIYVSPHCRLIGTQGEVLYGEPDRFHPGHQSKFTEARISGRDTKLFVFLS